MAAKSPCPCTETITVPCGSKNVSVLLDFDVYQASQYVRDAIPRDQSRTTSKCHFNQRQIPGLSYIKIPLRFAYTYLLYLLFYEWKRMIGYKYRNAPWNYDYRYSVYQYYYHATFETS